MEKLTAFLESEEVKQKVDSVLREVLNRKLPLFEQQIRKDERNKVLDIVGEEIEKKIVIHKELEKQFTGSIADIIVGIKTDNCHTFVIKNLLDIKQILTNLKK